MIYGVANSPIPDRENELISAEAMKKAIPTFLKAYSDLHLDHTERRIGKVTECRVLEKGDCVLSPNHEAYDPDAREGDTYFKAWIDDDPDNDDVWDAIVKGIRNKISIFGVRTETSPECRIAPHERASPCVTKGIRLWSFSLVGENAINPNSYIKIAKAFSSDLCDAFETKTVELIKAAFPDSNMAPDPKPGNDSTSDGTTLEDDVVVLKSDVAEMKGGITAILDFIKKSEEKKESEEEESEEEKKKKESSSGESGSEPVKKANDYITKAALEPVIDLIVKAKVELAVADIKKAYGAKITALEARIEEFGNETIRKGGNVVVIKGSDSDDEAENPFLSNLDALSE